MTTSNPCYPLDGCQFVVRLTVSCHHCCCRHCPLSSHLVAGSVIFCPLPSLWLIVVLFLSWALSAPAVFNKRVRHRALLSSLANDGGISAHPSAIVITVSFSFRIGHLCTLLSSPSPTPSFVDCCVMFMPAATKKPALLTSSSE